LNDGRVGKHDRFITAALAAVALLGEAACSDDERVRCNVLDPRTHTVRHVEVPAQSTCPPSTTIATNARPATMFVPGWFYYGGTAFYGRLRRGAKPASQMQAEDLQHTTVSSEEEMTRQNTARMSEAHFGESGARGGFGG
jgi:hypothetical protein